MKRDSDGKCEYGNCAWWVPRRTTVIGGSEARGMCAVAKLSLGVGTGVEDARDMDVVRRTYTDDEGEL